MGVNMAGFCISDDEVCCRAAKDEVNSMLRNGTIIENENSENTIDKMLNTMFISTLNQYGLT